MKYSWEEEKIHTDFRWEKAERKKPLRRSRSIWWRIVKKKEGSVCVD
jgi:hypothetical protein